MVAGVRAALEVGGQVVVVGSATSVTDTYAVVATTSPDVVLLDFRLPDGTGIDAAREARRAAPDAAHVFLTAEPTDDNLAEAVEAGAAGFLSKSVRSDVIEDAVVRAAAGEMVIPPADLARLLAGRGRRRAETQARARRRAEFSPRELDVLRLVAEGLDATTVAARLHLAVSTVRWHVQNLLSKLDAHSKLEAVARARDEGLV